ncbi:hypothetical protein BLOT_000275 [Blomia tropicalis]|nr:hypothetical protein BLOT_000275 [Blomia tropicalis]
MVVPTNAKKSIISTQNQMFFGVKDEIDEEGVPPIILDIALESEHDVDDLIMLIMSIYLALNSSSNIT